MTTAAIKRPAPPRLALTKAEAADSLGISVDSFERYVQPHVKAVRRGRKLRLFPVRDLERWLDESATRMAEDLGFDT